MYTLGRRQGPFNRPDESRAVEILGATLTVTIAALITTIARMYVRIAMIKSVGWDVSDCAIMFVFFWAKDVTLGLCSSFDYGTCK